jgi:hypothetical protein
LKDDPEIVVARRIEEASTEMAQDGAGALARPELAWWVFRHLSGAGEAQVKVLRAVF